jgi:ribosomal protein L29
MTVKVLEKKSDKDLMKDLQKKRNELREIRFGMSGAKAQKPHASKQLRREVAQILTELHGRTSTDATK